MSLKGKIIKVRDLAFHQKEEMFNLFSSYFDGTNINIFYKDLEEKDEIILLEERFSCKICGFSTLVFFTLDLGGEVVRCVFSGDTIVDKKFWWGETELVKIWVQSVIAQIEKSRGDNLYWILTSMGYRTYRFGTVYLKEFYPRFDKNIPVLEKKIIDAFGYKKYPNNYLSDKGLICFNGQKERLKPEIARIPPHRLNDPHIRFFLTRNPFYAKGDELVCIAPLTLDNFKSIVYRILRKI